MFEQTELGDVKSGRPNLCQDRQKSWLPMILEGKTSKKNSFNHRQA